MAIGGASVPHTELGHGVRRGTFNASDDSCLELSNHFLPADAPSDAHEEAEHRVLLWRRLFNSGSSLQVPVLEAYVCLLGGVKLYLGLESPNAVASAALTTSVSLGY